MIPKTKNNTEDSTSPSIDFIVASIDNKIITLTAIDATIEKGSCRGKMKSFL